MEKNSQSDLMDKYEKFRQLLEVAVAEFRQVSKAEIIRVISHLDADGLSSAAILIKALERDGRNYSLSTVHQLDEKFVTQVMNEPYKNVFFTDIGSGQIGLIRKCLKSKKIFILDHHQFEDNDKSENVCHVNPHMVGINGSTEVSGSGVTYLFARTLNEENVDLAHIAIVGAIGDVQEARGFQKLNREILEDAKKTGKIKQITGLRIFGVQTKPLHKIIEKSTDHPIPGVTGSESAAIMFLQEIGINPRKSSGWKKLTDLTDEELQRLATEIILRRLDEEKPEEILGPVYIFTEEQNESPLRDAKEFATLLNACGRLGKASVGIGACFGSSAIKEKAIKTMGEYKRAISNAMKWYKNAKNSIITNKGYLIINAEENVRPTIIGTVASILSKSGTLSDGTFILSMAQIPEEGKTKISFRISGNGNDVNLRELIGKIVEPVNGLAGGHHQAAGALIDTEKEAEFIRSAKLVLEAQSMEQRLA